MSYTSPAVRDYGSLVALTQQFDASFVVGTAKMLTMAAISSPLTPGSDTGGNIVSVAPHNYGVDIPGTSGGGGGGTHVIDSPGGAPGASGKAGLHGGGVVAVSGSGGGKLPFTGYAATTAAYLGAVMTMTGIAIRAKLRRRPQ